MGIFEYFGIIIPSYRFFLGVMGRGAECGVVEGKEKKSLGMRQMLCGFTDIFALLQLKRCLPCKYYSACYTMLLPKVLGKRAGEDFLS